MTTAPEAASAQDDQASGRLLGMLMRAAELTRADVAEAVAAFDLPLPLARTVIELDNPAPMRNLADVMQCDRSYITGIADGLEERGLVQRVTGADRRVKLLTLTPKGREVRASLLAAMGRQSRGLSNLSDDDRRALAHLLAAMLEGAPGESACCPLASG